MTETLKAGLTALDKANEQAACRHRYSPDFNYLPCVKCGWLPPVFVRALAARSRQEQTHD